MARVKKSVDNLIGVAKSICDDHFSNGLGFYSDFVVINNCIVLISPSRNAIGASIICNIPSNYKWRVTFSGGCLKLYIWF